MKKTKKINKFLLLSAFIISATLFPGCKNENEIQRQTAASAETAQEENSGQRQLKYIIRSDNGLTGFFSDGSAALGPWYDLNEATTEALYSQEPFGRYEELGDGLIIDGRKINFLNDEGAIAGGWVMINFLWTNAQNAVTDYTTYNGSFHSDDIMKIENTAFIEIMPEIRTFEDENSDEAEVYFSAMDDYAYYISESRSRFENLGVKSVPTKNRYLVFELTGGKEILIDVQKEQNGKGIGALIYKKGKLPLIVDIADNNIEQFKQYLRD